GVGAGDLVGVDPMLGPLQDNGGPTLTHALLADSPAIDAGDDSVLAFLTTDQRGPGFPRKSCAHVDIGAFESAGGPVITCPANITVGVSAGQSSAAVSFAANAADLCDTALALTYVAGNGTITSPSTFPIGTTVVTAIATDSSGATANCSFTVTVVPFDICLIDDSTGNLLQWSSATGDYKFTQCALGGITLSGTGTARLVSSVQSLSDSKPDRRVAAMFLTGQQTGS